MDRNNCKECGKEFKKLGKLQRHIREIHENLKPFKCDICQKDFKRNSHLKRHLTCHSENPKPFGCTLDGCAQRFSNKHHLVRHIKIVHDQDRYRCKSCHLSFKKKKFLQKHLSDEHASFQGPETVDSTRNPRCNELPLVYDESVQKKIKKEEENEFDPLFDPCDSNKLLGFLEYGFQDLLGSVPAEKIEHKEPPARKTLYPCYYEGCSKTFSKMNNLKSHVRSVHLKVKLFKCDKPDCKASFLHKSSLKRHTLQKHASYSEGSPNAMNLLFPVPEEYYMLPRTNYREFFNLEENFNNFIDDSQSLRFNLPIKPDELSDL